MYEQLSFSLSDEVAPVFNNERITNLCKLIDQKANSGRKYNDLKEQLLTWIAASADLNNQSPQFDIYRKVYEFVKYY